MDRRLLPLAAALLAAAGPAAAAPSEADLLDMIQKLGARVEALEKRNADLEQALDRDTVSETEPELAARLKAVEMDTQHMQKAARQAEGLEGIAAGASLTTTAQRPSGLGPASPAKNSQLNYRGDVFVSLPLAPVGDVEDKLYAQFRLGQGSGLNALPTYSKPNASAFRVLSANPDDSVAVLGQAWYQATVPLPLGGFKPRSRESLEFNFGKMDPFAFFDQNAAANDETRQFLNTVFVHNPLLDAGGDIGVDANGFSPGLRLSYVNAAAKPDVWRLSLGVFGAGQGANYTRFFSSPLVIAQAETQVHPFAGLPGNLRLYAWRNGQGPDYTGRAASHTGWGVSADQSAGEGVTLFARFGRQIAGHVRFDRALTAGTELSGSYWDRGGDAIGLAYGWLRTSGDFARDSATVDANGDGVPDFAFAAGGAERVAELYYRYRISKQFALSPDFQYIATPGGKRDAAAITILGLRAQLSY